MMELGAYLHDKRIIVENTLKDVFASLKTTPGMLRDAMEYMLFSNGKRIRPILAIAACEANGKSSDDLLPVACTIEMIHTYSLIHDDLPSIDNDDIRRGRPTCHKVFGDAIAIRQMWMLALVVDHRIVDGAPAAKFLQYIKNQIENPDEVKLIM